MLASLPALVQTPLREPVHLLLSHDEEVGCLGGEQMVKDLARLNIQPTICIVGEPTGMRVIAAHKSINVFELTVNGVAAHSSRTPQGVNAIEYASRVVVFIRSLADDFRDKGPYDRAYDVPYTTASVNTITGGVAGNIVADRCQVEFEFRSISAVDPNVVRARIQTYCDELQKEMRLENSRARVDLRSRAMVPGLETDATALQFSSERSSAASPRRARSTMAPKEASTSWSESTPSFAGPGRLPRRTPRTSLSSSTRFKLAKPSCTNSCCT
jgi:acetylornithine deacetylase